MACPAIDLVSHPLRYVSIGVVAILLTACGGGGGGGATSSGSGATVPVVAPTGSTATASSAPTIFTITIAGNTATTASTRRAPSYISSAIQTVDFRLTSVVPAGSGVYTGALNTDTLVAVTVGSPNCVLQANGNNVCTASANEPAPATDTFTVYTFAVANPVIGTTTPLSINVGFSTYVTPSGPNNVAVSTNGVPATLMFSPAVVSSVSPATAASFTTQLLVTDAGGSTLIGGSNFANASGVAGSVQFTGCDAHLTPTPASINAATPALLGSGQISVAYDGALSAGSLHCYATGPGGLTAQYTVNLSGGNSGGVVAINIPPPQPVICTPASVSFGVAQRVVVSCASDGFSGSIASTVADTTIASVVLAAGTSTLFYVSGLQIGTTTASFVTTSGGTGILPISVGP